MPLLQSPSCSTVKATGAGLACLVHRTQMEVTLDASALTSVYHCAPTEIPLVFSGLS